MDIETFNELVEKRIDLIKSIFLNKAKEYATEDRLYNFKRAAKISNTTPQKALLGMLMKHLVSVLDLAEGRINNTEEMVNEKIGDSINYHILLEAILCEGRKHSENLCFGPKAGTSFPEGVAE